MVAKGLGHLRAETVQMVGYMDMRSASYKVLLSENRLVRTRNATFNFQQTSTQEGDTSHNEDDEDHADQERE